MGSIGKPCRFIRCPKLAEDGKFYCENHQDYELSVRQEKNRKADLKRGKQDPLYGSQKWKKTRDYVLRREPLCRMCQGPAEMVDHITPIKQGGLRLNLSNLQPLCTSCHRFKTIKENN